MQPIRAGCNPKSTYQVTNGPILIEQNWTKNSFHKVPIWHSRYKADDIREDDPLYPQMYRYTPVRPECCLQFTPVLVVYKSWRGLLCSGQTCRCDDNALSPHHVCDVITLIHHHSYNVQPKPTSLRVGGISGRVSYGRNKSVQLRYHITRLDTKWAMPNHVDLLIARAHPLYTVNDVMLVL